VRDQEIMRLLEVVLQRSQPAVDPAVVLQ